MFKIHPVFSDFFVFCKLAYIPGIGCAHANRQPSWRRFRSHFGLNLKMEADPLVGGDDDAGFVGGDDPPARPAIHHGLPRCVLLAVPFTGGLLEQGSDEWPEA
jgi:hypothetical protein